MLENFWVYAKAQTHVPPDVTFIESLVPGTKIYKLTGSIMTLWGSQIPPMSIEDYHRRYCHKLSTGQWVYVGSDYLKAEDDFVVIS